MQVLRTSAARAVPALASLGLLLAACGGSGATEHATAEAPGLPPGAAAGTGETPDTGAGSTASGTGQPAPGSAGAGAPGAEAAGAEPARPGVGHPALARSGTSPRSADRGGATDPGVTSTGPAGSAGAPATARGTRPGAATPSGRAGARAEDGAARAGADAAARSAAVTAADRKVYAAADGATDVGVTREEIRLGEVNMHGMALGNILVAPQVRGNLATLTSINDRGGVLGRRLSITDCDDGPGEVARSKACIKKLVGQDKIFALVTGIDWATASIHDDMRTFGLPYVGTWAYSQTEWQDPFMFPAHTSMIHEAMAGAAWVRDTVRPKTYGLLCLTSPEMQLACNQVQRVLGDAGIKLVKKVDVGISETSISAQILAMRAANPDHVVHYVINAATMAKFMLEAQQQGYYPPLGISGNHLAAEVLGSIFGSYPAGRYWTNTTYKLWGAEFAAVMGRYARGNKGLNHHIIQAGYTGINIFARAAKEVGPNLTRSGLMAQLGNGTVWESDPALDQRFQYIPSERSGEHWSRDNAQGREFMYKYVSANTVGNPDGSPSGFLPAENWVIHTH